MAKVSKKITFAFEPCSVHRIPNHLTFPTHSEYEAMLRHYHLKCTSGSIYKPEHQG